MIVEHNRYMGYGQYGTRVVTTIVSDKETVQRVTVDENIKGYRYVALGGYHYSPAQARELAMMLIKAAELVEAEKP